MKTLRNKLDSAKTALKVYEELDERVNELYEAFLTKTGKELDDAFTAFDDAFYRKDRAKRTLISTTKAVVAACGLEMADPKKPTVHSCSECLMIVERRIAQAEAILGGEDFWESTYVKPRNK